MSNCDGKHINWREDEGLFYSYLYDSKNLFKENLMAVSSIQCEDEHC